VDTTEASVVRARTKIVATVGPACSTREQLTALIKAGVDVFRINMAHGSRSEHEEVLKAIREVSFPNGRPIGVLIDLAGPKIRLGQLHEEPLTCHCDELFRLVRGRETTDRTELPLTYPQLIDELAVGDRVLLADAAVSMIVVECGTDYVEMRVIDDGVLRSRQGINVPGTQLGIAALSEVDLDNAVWAAQVGIDFVGLSFVRSPVEVRQLSSLLRSHGSHAQVIAKIEKPEAIEHLEEITIAADGIMVARGDLGVEIDVAQIAVAQKQIIATCNRLRKPVIVATQMLDSMQRSLRPTRAEATDVANAILDGADACMLSGETAIGENPRAAVEMMNRIMLATEPSLADQPSPPSNELASVNVHPITLGVVYGAATIAQRLAAKLVVVVTKSGATALAKAKQRDFIPTVAVSSSPEVLRQLCLPWGITPLPDAPIDDERALHAFIDQWGQADGTLAPNDRVVFVSGSGVVPTAHNRVDVLVIGETSGSS